MLTRSEDGTGQVEQTLEQNEEAEASTTTTRPGASTTRRPLITTTSVTPGFVEVEGVPPGQPLLGETVGLTLFVGGRSLLAIDLDTGELAEHDVIEAPVLATDRWLLVRDANGFQSVIARDDLTAAPRVISGEGWSRMVTTDGPEHVWVFEFDQTDQTQRWKSVSLADGTPRTVLEAAPYGGGSGEPGVATTLSGGVFVLNGDQQSYRRIADGFPLATSEDFVLVRWCESPLTASCRTYWIDRTTGDEVDRFVPALQPSWWGVWSSPSGGFLVVESDEWVSLWDIERGTMVDSVPNGRPGCWRMNASVAGW